jgi:AraC-like DNA-binding protein
MSDPAEPAYREGAPPADLAGPVACLWRARVGGRRAAVLPDGCTDLLWCSGPGEPRLIVAGPDTGPVPVTFSPGTRVLGIRFRPGVAPAAFGLPADELSDGRPELADVWSESGAVRHLTEVLATTPDADRPAVLAAAVRARLAAAPPVDPLVGPVLTGLAGGGPWPVRGLARRVGLSERQLHRRCRAAFGYGPKTLDRVLRLQRFLRLAAIGSAGPADLALAAGYADQAHLGHECRALTGSTPAALVTERGRGPVSDPDKTARRGAA